MNFVQAFKMATKSIRGNKMRTFLTMLGIIIGVAAVIIMVSIVQGATKQITDQVASMGTNMLTITLTGQNTTKTVDMKDMDEMVAENPDCITGVAPNITGRVTIKYGNTNKSINVVGTNSVFSTVRNVKVSEGRFINEDDVEGRRNFAVIGSYNVQDLFGGQDPIGENIKLNGKLYTVIGVLEEKARSRQNSEDDRVIIPYMSAKSLLRNARINAYYLEAKGTDEVEKALARAEEFLLRKLGHENAFNVNNMQDMIDRVEEMTGTMAAMMGGIAGISLLVGGIGIMNIMLVSVTERTREIGIRKAIGAKRSSIMTQFLIESVVVSCFGGIIGIVLGGFSAVGLGNTMSINAMPQVPIIVLSFGFAAFIGIFFGWYPANKASKLSPIEALRFE